MVAKAGVFGSRQYATDVLQVALENLSVKLNRAVELGVKLSRQVPDPEGNMRDTALFDAIDYTALERKVRQLHDRIDDYEHETGRDAIDPTVMVMSGLRPETMAAE